MTLDSAVFRFAGVVVLASLAEGLRVVTVVLQPWLPATTAKLLAALGTPDHALEAAQLGARRVGVVQPIEPLFPKQPPEPAAA